MNQTIYFRKEVWKILSGIEKKSELVNELLEKHFDLPSVVTQRNELDKLTTRRKVAKKPEVIKTKQEAIETVKKVFPEAEPVTYKKTSSWGA